MFSVLIWDDLLYAFHVQIFVCRQCDWQTSKIELLGQGEMQMQQHLLAALPLLISFVSAVDNLTRQGNKEVGGLVLALFWRAKKIVTRDGALTVLAAASLIASGLEPSRPIIR